MQAPEHRPKKKLWLNAVVLLGAVALAVWLWPRETPEPGSSSGVSTTTTNAVPVPGETAAPFHGLAALLRAAPDAATARRQLTELRARLASMPVPAAVAEIRRILDSRADAPTRLGFKIASGGALDEAPTLRTFLLDELARLDPAAAAEYAQSILARKDSPDEWAVALRNLARGDASAEGRALLEQKTGELLRHEPWQREPSAGYLEAFDTAVFLGGTSLLPALAALQAAPEWMAGREQTRANYFARGDVRVARQREILENYFSNPQLSAAELDAFAGSFPNASFMLSQNLLTPSRTPEHAALAARDAESLRMVRAWLADPRFAMTRRPLRSMTFVFGPCWYSSASSSPTMRPSFTARLLASG